MDSETRKILAKIASIQVEAIEFIKKDTNIDKELACTYLQVNIEDFKEQTEHLLDLYKQMEEIPTIIRCLDEYQLLVCSHILHKMQEDWGLYNNQGVLGAWNEIHRALLKFHPEYTLSRV